MANVNICVVLPSPVAYSETFLQAHIDRLSAAVNYLQDFPIDVDEVFPKQISADRTEQLKRQVRVCLHRYILNPVKKHSLRKFFKRNGINVVLAEYGLNGNRCFKIVRRIEYSAHRKFSWLTMHIQPSCSIDINTHIRGCSITPA